MTQKKLKFTDDDEIEAAFRYYRNRGFPFPKLTKHEQIHIFRQLQNSMSKINKDDSILLGGHKIITRMTINDVTLANIFHPHIWESHALNMRSAVQSFNIDSSLKKVFRLCLKHDGLIEDKNVLKFLKLVNGTQICSNFRPSSAKAIYDYFNCENTLDMSTGYGGRLLGFIASSSKGTYTGIDPSQRTHKGNLKLANAFKSSHRVKLICKAFEDVDIEELGKPDLAFTSPPYFLKEIYDENSQKQSRERYPNYRSWRKNFLYVLLKKTYQVLTRNGTLALNVADVKIKNKRYPIVADSIAFASKLGFRLVDKLYFKISGFGKGAMGAKSEPILIFRK